MAELSICFLTWNNIDTLPKALEVVREDKYDRTIEVIVVDNGSDDGTEEYATIKNKTNLGISKGKNQCIDHSSGRYIMFIDGDIIPVRNSIASLCNYMDSHRYCKAIGFPPNKGIDQIEKALSCCYELVDIRTQKFPCLFYGLYHRDLFDYDGVRCDESGAFAGVGYGAEDHDFYMQMKQAGVDQWVCNMNHSSSRYYHKVNSSIKNMGRETYLKTAKARNKQFKEKWKDAFSEVNT